MERRGGRPHRGRHLVAVLPPGAAQRTRPLLLLGAERDGLPDRLQLQRRQRGHMDLRRARPRGHGIRDHLRRPSPACDPHPSRRRDHHLCQPTGARHRCRNLPRQDRAVRQLQRWPPLHADHDQRRQRRGARRRPDGRVFVARRNRARAPVIPNRRHGRGEGSPAGLGLVSVDVRRGACADRPRRLG